MSETKAASQTRQHEHQLDIKASPDAVWKAITEASELVNWFPLEAEVQAGEGGLITYGWGDLRGTCEVQIWEPERHLRTSWMQAPAGGGAGAHQVAVDWYLEGGADGTRLRLVHSGFGLGQEWDEEYNGTRRGWSYELRSLKHYLEHHVGEKRKCFWLRQSLAEDPTRGWARLIHPQGLLQSAALATAREGERISTPLSTGDHIEGSVLLSIPPTDIALVVDNWNQGLLRTSFENCGAGPEATIMLSLWNYPDAEARALRDRLQRALQQTFQ